MCWHYEVFYSGCFDHFDGSCDGSGMTPKESIDSLPKLMETYGMKIKDWDEFRGRVFEFYTKLHDDGVIKPQDGIPKPSIKDVKQFFSIIRRKDGKDTLEEYIKERKDKGLNTFINVED